MNIKIGYHIHHLNQIKTDNRLQNLVYLTHSEHSKLHNIGNKYCLGKKHTDQAKAKIRAAKKGKTGYWKGKTGPMKGKTLSEEHKAKIRAAHNKKQVYCVELDRVFQGINIAAKELYLRADHISLCCNRKRKTTGGYHFQFV